jgi:hypothetical protein
MISSLRMIVRVRDPLGATISIEASELWTVLQLKTAIHQHKGTPIPQIRLIHLGREITNMDQSSLQSLNISEKTVISLMIRSANPEFVDDEGEAGGEQSELLNEENEVIPVEIELLRDCLKHSIRVRRNCILMLIVTVIASIPFPFLLSLSFVSLYGYTTSRRFSACLIIPVSRVRLHF